MKVFRRERLSIIICLSVIFLMTFGTQSHGREWKKFLLTSRTYSEKDDLNRAVAREFGHDYSIADWTDLKAIGNIDAWISNLGLQHGQTFMITVNGKFRYSGNRQYFIYYSTIGRPPSGFLVHDKISNKLFLGSWFGEHRKILVINKGGRNDENFKLTYRTYSEKDDLNHAVAREFGHDYSIADWTDLKAVGNINAWISHLGLQHGQTFMVTVNGKFRYSGNRQYFIYYSVIGRPPSGFLVHDQISNKLFLGSWYGENRKILVINKSARNDADYNPPSFRNNFEKRAYGNFKLTYRTYSEKDDLNHAVAREFGYDFSIADWTDLKAIPNIDEWISYMGLRNEQSFFVTRDGQFIYSGNRQYNVQYFASGNVPSNYLVHDQIGNRLFLGSWYDLNEQILVIKK